MGKLNRGGISSASDQTPRSIAGVEDYLVALRLDAPRSWLVKGLYGAGPNANSRRDLEFFCESRPWIENLCCDRQRVPTTYGLLKFTEDGIQGGGQGLLPNCGPSD